MGNWISVEIGSYEGVAVKLKRIHQDFPSNTIRRDDGWNAFRIQGVLNFSLVGILSKISTILANNAISIFAVSTYDTDYVLIKSKDYQRGLEILESSGYKIVD